MCVVPSLHQAVQGHPPQEKPPRKSLRRHRILILFIDLLVLSIAFVMAYCSALIFFNNNSQSGDLLLKPKSMTVSPLYSLFPNHEQKADDQRSDEGDAEVVERMNRASSFETTKLLIAETVVAMDKKDELVGFVAEQIRNNSASGVLSSSQASAIIKMVKLSPKASGILKEEIGQEGSLRSSAVMALIKEHEGNLHFMMLGVKMEPHLGWKWISTWERNSWNNAVSRLLHSKLMTQARSYLTLDQSHEAANLQPMNTQPISDSD